MTKFTSAAVLAIGAFIPAVQASMVQLVSFDNNASTTWNWRDMNDPVMGGASVSTFVIDPKLDFAAFNGSCNIVPSLKAPGFAKAYTTTSSTGATFQDVEEYLDGDMYVYARSSTPEYKGFKIAFGAKNVPHNGPYGGGSFKAPFAFNGGDWQLVKVPFNTFSWDWSGYTGSCETKDPNGKQHVCCTKDTPQVCPTKAFLSTITGVELWAEGTQGLFQLDVKWIGAGN